MKLVAENSVARSWRIASLLGATFFVFLVPGPLLWRLIACPLALVGAVWTAEAQLRSIGNSLPVITLDGNASTWASQLPRLLGTSLWLLSFFVVHNLFFFLAVAALATGSWCGCSLLGAVQYGIYLWLRPDAIAATDTAVHIRGARLKTIEQVRALVLELLRPGEKTLTWGGVRVPENKASTHFVVVGTSGSGKSLTIRSLLHEVIPDIVAGSDSRAFIYDAKGDALAMLAMLEMQAPVHLLHPFDARGAAWDVAVDITTPAEAVELAHFIVPQNEHSMQPFYPDAARKLITGVVQVLQQAAAKRWTLRDLILACDPDYIQSVLRYVPDVHRRTKPLAETQEWPGILSTVSTRLEPLEALAAGWHAATYRISLQEWAETSSILVLPSDPQIKETIDVVNQLIVRRLSLLLRSQADSDRRRTWFFLDEFRSTGKLTGLDLLLTEGRSKGVCVVLGFQDIDGLKEAYGDKLPYELTGMCAHWACFRTKNANTREWLSKSLGSEDRIETLQNISRDPDRSNPTTSENQQRVEREIVSPSQFGELPMPDKARGIGLTGYYDAPHYGIWLHHTPSAELAARLPSLENSPVPKFVPRDAPKTLQHWDQADLERLGLANVITLPGVPPPAKADGQRRRLWDVQ